MVEEIPCPARLHAASLQGSVGVRRAVSADLSANGRGSLKHSLTAPPGRLSPCHRAIAYGISATAARPSTPTPNPSPQGGGGLCGRYAAHNRRRLVLVGDVSRSLSPLWGGVRGGGKRICDSSAPSRGRAIAHADDDRHSGAAQRNPESRALVSKEKRNLANIQEFRAASALWIPGSAARPRNDDAELSAPPILICDRPARAGERWRGERAGEGALCRSKRLTSISIVIARSSHHGNPGQLDG
jgi:hypothetical protein